MSDMGVIDMLQAIQDPGLFARLTARIAALEAENAELRREKSAAIRILMRQDAAVCDLVLESMGLNDSANGTGWLTEDQWRARLAAPSPDDKEA